MSRLNGRRLAASLGAVLGLGVLALMACRPAPRQNTIDDLLGPRANTPPPASAGACHFDLSGEKADTVFVVLGLLNEYLGRHILEDDDLVERFFCNEHDTAAFFRRTLARLAREQGLDPAVREETAQECLLFYRSKAIADRLNSCYRFQATGGTAAPGTDGTYRRVAEASLGMELFRRGGRAEWTFGVGRTDSNFYRRRALAYLSGAWARYGRDGDFVFANSQEKARLIASLLSDLGCQRVRLESNVGFIPQTNWVHFEPTDEVKAWFGKTW
jgi:hypothetical protein